MRKPKVDQVDRAENLASPVFHRDRRDKPLLLPGSTLKPLSAKKKSETTFTTFTMFTDRLRQLPSAGVINHGDLHPDPRYQDYHDARL